VTLYQTVNQDLEHYSGARAVETSEPQACRRCGEALPSRQFVVDLKATLTELRQDYDFGPERGWLQDYCPTCKRALRAEAYYQLMGKRFL
jgi:hypothetical protein